MSTQQYYPPPNGYRSAPPPQPQRAPVQYNPAGYNPGGYNPGLYQQQSPPSPPPVNMQQQSGIGYNPGGYYPPGRSTPQPVVGGRGYVPYANLQGVIGGVNRSASTSAELADGEAPPPYSPPQRPGVRGMQGMPAPTLGIPNGPPNMGRPVSGQPPNLYTPVTPNAAYQPMGNQGQRVIQGQPVYQQPQVGPQLQQQQQHQQQLHQQYPPPDPRRVASPPVQYSQGQGTVSPPQPQQPQQQYHHQHHASLSQPMTIPAYVSQNTGQNPTQAPSQQYQENSESPPSPTALQRSQTIAVLPPTGARRERDSLPLRRPAINTANSEPGPNSAVSTPQAQTSQQSMGPPTGGRSSAMGVPPPPPGPPPPGAVAARRHPSENLSISLSRNSTTPGIYPQSANNIQTPTTAGGSALPNGMLPPPPPPGAPPKPILIQPAPIGKKRNRIGGATTGSNSSENGGESALTSPVPKTPKTPSYGAYSGPGGGLPFRSVPSTPNPVTPGTAGFSSSQIKPQSIMRSQKSIGDLASGGLRTTTPKDVRFAIPDDESEYDDSTADGDSRRGSEKGVEDSPAMSPAEPPPIQQPRTPRTPGGRFPGSDSDDSKNTRMASIDEESAYFEDSRMRSFQDNSRKVSIPLPAMPGWTNDKDKDKDKESGRESIAAPSADIRFNASPTPPFSPDRVDNKAEQEATLVGKLNSMTIEPRRVSPPPSQSTSMDRLPETPVSGGGHGDDEEPVEDLPPFYHEAIGRHNDMILEEASALNDEKRLNVFVDFVMEEARMRGEMYNNALGVLGPGLQLFPTEDPQFMTPEQQVIEFERAEYERSLGTGGGSSLKRTTTVSQKSRDRTFGGRLSGTASNPTTPGMAPANYKRSSWFDTAIGGHEASSTSGAKPTKPVLLPNGQMYYPEGVYPPEKPKFQEQRVPQVPDSIDIEPLLAIIPPYPRQFPASDNSHPRLGKVRKAIAGLKDLTIVQKIRFDFATSVPRVQDEIAAESRARRSQHQDHTQQLYNEGRVTYEQMDQMDAKFERDEGERKALEIKNEFDRYQKEVMGPAHSELMDRIEQTTALIDEMQKDIASISKASGTVREGPELLERLNLMRSAFEMREMLHREVNEVISDRNKRYKEVVIAPFLNDRDAEQLKEAEEFFDEDSKRLKVEADKEALMRAAGFMAQIEKNVIRGVEKEVSDFWDVAPTLTAVLDKIPQNLSNFRPVVPEDELFTNPNYRRFPALYLRTQLEYAGNSIYQHAQAQMRLLGFSLDITVVWTNAKWALKDSERVMAGEEEQRTVWQLERQKKEEEVRQTKNWEEKLKTVKEEWSQSIGNNLNGVKKRLQDHLISQGGWPTEN